MGLGIGTCVMNSGVRGLIVHEVQRWRQGLVLRYLPWYLIHIFDYHGGEFRRVKYREISADLNYINEMSNSTTHGNMSSSENRGPDTYAIFITFTIIAGIVVILRFFTRLRIVKNVGCEDWMILIALVSFSFSHISQPKWAQLDHDNTGDKPTLCQLYVWLED